MKDKIKIFITLFIMVSIVYLIASYFMNLEANNIETINKDPNQTRGLVIKKKVYKGRSIHVSYIVDGKKYIGIDGLNDSDKVNVGDSIDVKYSLSHPELMITQFNDKY